MITLETATQMGTLLLPWIAMFVMAILLLVSAFRLGARDRKILALTEQAIKWQNIADGDNKRANDMRHERDKKAEAHKLIGKDMRKLRKEREGERAAHREELAEMTKERNRYRRVTDLIIAAREKEEILDDDNS